MFFVPGLIISLVTFPGVIVHETGHRLFCDLVGVPVYHVRYFSLGNPVGYVVYGTTAGLRDEFLIAVGPLILNTILCAFICFVPIISLNLNVSDEPVVLFILLWLGISIGMQAFPSNQDAENFLSAVREAKKRGPLLFASVAFQVLIRIANRLRTVWFGFVYAVAVAWLAPGIIALIAIVSDGP